MPPLFTSSSVAGRRAFAAAGLLAGASWLGGVLWLFGHAGPGEWPQGRPQAAAEAARCEALPRRAAREHCARGVAAARGGRAEGEARLAQR